MKKPAIKHVSVSELVPYARNARKHSDAQIDQIAASIREFGFLSPCVVSEDKTIIAGHGRVLAAKKLGLTDVPCVVADHLTDEQRRAYVLIDNRLTDTSEWDKEILQIELAALADSDIEMELMGFSPEEIGELDLVVDDEQTEGLTDEDAVPEAPAAPVTKTGDIWLLGNHRVMCGDSTNNQDIERLMDGKTAKFCFTSPPYSDMREYDGNCDLRPETIAQFLSAPCELFAVNLGLKRSDNNVVPYWDVYINRAKQFGLKFLSWNVWDQGFSGSVGKLSAMFPICHEWILVFGTHKKRLNPTVINKTAGEKNNHVGDRQASGETRRKRDVEIRPMREMGTIISLPPMMSRKETSHPAMFPVVLAESYIEACSGVGDSIFEPFCGSGSTLIACEKTARRCFGMEISPQYCDVIVKRWQDFTGKKATLESDGRTFDEVSSTRQPPAF